MSINFTVQIYYGFMTIDPKLFYHTLLGQLSILHKNSCIRHTFQFVYQIPYVSLFLPPDR